MDITTYNEQVEIVKNATKQMLNRIYQKREYNHDSFGQKKIGRTTLGISKGEKKSLLVRSSENLGTLSEATPLVFYTQNFSHTVTPWNPIL